MTDIEQIHGFDINTGVSDIKAGPVNLGLSAGFSELQTDTKAIGPDQIHTQIYRIAAHGRTRLNAEGKGPNANLDAAIGLATGTNDIEQNIVSPALGISACQNARTGIESLNGIVRLQMDGSNGNDWKIKPHLLAAYETLIQDGFTLGGSQPTALDVVEFKADRYTLGYGATFEHEWNEGSYTQLRVSGLHHLGDTQTTLISQFNSVGVSVFDFETTGQEIDDQYLIEGGFGRSFDNGWSGELHGFAEFGDIEGFGARLSMVRKF